MSTVIRLALHDLKLTVRDRSSFLWMLLLPLALMWVFGNVAGGGGSDARASLTVVDRDGGWLARAMIDEIADDERFAVRELTPEEAATAENKVRTLVIPEGFTEGVVAGDAHTLRLEKEPGSAEDFGIAAEVRILRTSVAAIGRLIELDRADAEEDAVADAATGETLAARYAALAERERLVVLDVETAGAGRPVPSGRAQSVPGMLTMTVTMMTMIYGAVLLTLEKRDGTMRRQLMGPLTERHVVLGKLGGRFAIAGLQAAILLVAGRFLYGVDYGRSIVGLVVLVVAFTLAVAAIATFLGAVLRTPEQAGSIGWILGMLLAALGGCWWPAEVMPGFMQAIARALPTGWAMDGFHALISFGRGVDGVLVPAAVLLGFAAVFSALGARFLRTAGHAA